MVHVAVPRVLYLPTPSSTWDASIFPILLAWLRSLWRLRLRRLLRRLLLPELLLLHLVLLLQLPQRTYGVAQAVHAYEHMLREIACERNAKATK